MIQQVNTISGAGSVLIGFGLATIEVNQTSGLILVGIGAFLIIGVALLQKVGVNVQSSRK